MSMDYETTKQRGIRLAKKQFEAEEVERARHRELERLRGEVFRLERGNNSVGLERLCMQNASVRIARSADGLVRAVFNDGERRVSIDLEAKGFRSRIEGLVLVYSKLEEEP